MWEKRDTHSSACIRREMLHVAVVIPACIHVAAATRGHSPPSAQAKSF